MSVLEALFSKYFYCLKKNEKKGVYIPGKKSFTFYWRRDYFLLILSVLIDSNHIFIASYDLFG